MEKELLEKVNKCLTECYQALNILKIDATDTNLEALYIAKNNIKEVAKLLNAPNKE
jgi:methylase of polypeptide subunit release factors